MNTKQTGDISEAAVVAALLKLGKSVLIPFGDRSRYDVALDEDGKLVRVQVKTGWRRGGLLVFKTVSSTRQSGRRIDTPYGGQIEMFAVYNRDTDQIYMVPVGKCGTGYGYLRLDEPKKRSNQTRIRYAKDFLLGR